MSVIKERNRKLGENLAEALKRRHFDAYFCDNRNEALDVVLSLIESGKSVGWGGSATLAECGVVEALYERGTNEIIDRTKIKKGEERDFTMKMSVADYFLCSANAISEDGEIVNIDGRGNRVCYTIFGPENVIMLVGMNKVAKTLEDAIARARNIAAPINAQRFDIDTPCKKLGKCMNCKSPDSICASMVIHRISKVKGRIKVILINEELGF